MRLIKRKNDKQVYESIVDKLKTIEARLAATSLYHITKIEWLEERVQELEKRVSE